MRTGLRCQHLNISNQYEGVGFTGQPVMGGYYIRLLEKLNENYQ